MSEAWREENNDGSKSAWGTDLLCNVGYFSECDVFTKREMILPIIFNIPGEKWNLLLWSLFAFDQLAEIFFKKASFILFQINVYPRYPPTSRLKVNCFTVEFPSSGSFQLLI